MLKVRYVCFGNFLKVLQNKQATKRMQVNRPMRKVTCYPQRRTPSLKIQWIQPLPTQTLSRRLQSLTAARGVSLKER